MASVVPLNQGKSTGWQASLSLGFEARGGRTVLARRQQRGPLAVQRPFYPEGAPCHLYLLHPPGGVVGGDSLDIRAEVASGAHALVTTPGATKFYRSAGAQALQTQTLQVADGAVLEWLPQENILFAGAKVRLATEIRLRGSARFIGWECHCLGRPVNHESFLSGQARFQFALYRDDRPLFCDRLNIMATRDLQRPSGLRGQPVIATLVATGADPAALQCARDAVVELDPQIAVTRIDELLIARYLGASTERARLAFVALWRALRPVLLAQPACAPRIWAT